MQNGKIKWFNPEKGYGFIRPDSGGGDIFLHIATVEEAGISSLEPGQPIKFESVESPKKDGKKSATKIEI